MFAGCILIFVEVVILRPVCEVTEHIDLLKHMLLVKTSQLWDLCPMIFINCVTENK